MKHYTSLENLEKILSNRTVRFNRLDRVDDLTEASRFESIDYAKFAFVSCWTNSRSENIALWNTYGGKMEGFCIDLQEYPFRFILDDGQVCSFTEVKRISEMNKGTPFRFKPFEVRKLEDSNVYLMNPIYMLNGEILNREFLFEVEYLRAEFHRGEKPFLSYAFADGSKETLQNPRVLARTKNRDWSFQKEKRYCIVLSLAAERSYWVGEPRNVPGIYRDASMKIMNEIDLGIDENCFNRIGIIAGPMCTNDSIMRAQEIIKNAGLTSNIRRSKWTGLIK